MKKNIEEFKAWDNTTIVFNPDAKYARYKIKETKESLTSPSSVVGMLDKSQALLYWNENLIREFKDNKIDNNYVYLGSVVHELFETALNLRKEKLEDAGKTGDLVHDYALAVANAKCKGELIPELPEMTSEQDQNGIRAFLKFEKDFNPTYIESEIFIFSPTFKFAGRFDSILEIKGVKYLIDWKTSKSIYPSQKIQLCGYHIAKSEEMIHTGVKLYDKLAMVHLDKYTGEYKFIELSDEEVIHGQDAFINLLRTKHNLKILNKNIWNYQNFTKKV